MINEISLVLRAKDMFTGTFQKMDSGLKSMISGIQGYFTAGAVMGAIKQFSNTLVEIRQNSEQLGVSTTAFQVLSASASKVGLSIENLNRGFSTMRDAQGQAAAGGANNPIVKSLNAINVSVADFVSASPEKAFEMLSQAMVKAGGDVTKISAIFDIIGKQAGYRFNAVMRDVGAKGMENMAAGMESNGKLISQAMINTFDSAERAIKGTQKKLNAGIAWQLQSASHFTGKDFASIAVGGLGAYLVALKRVQGEVERENSLIEQGAKIEEEARSKQAAAAQAEADAKRKKEAATKAEWENLVAVDKAQKELNATLREGRMAGMDPTQRRDALWNEVEAINQQISGLTNVKNAEAAVLELENDRAKLQNEMAEIDRQEAARNVAKAKEAAQSYLAARLQIMQLMQQEAENAGGAAAARQNDLAKMKVGDFIAAQKAAKEEKLSAAQERAKIQALEAKAGKNWENFNKLNKGDQELLRGSKRKKDADIEAWGAKMKALNDQIKADKMLDAIQKAQEKLSEKQILKLDEIKKMLDLNLKVT